MEPLSGIIDDWDFEGSGLSFTISSNLFEELLDTGMMTLSPTGNEVRIGTLLVRILVQAPLPPQVRLVVGGVAAAGILADLLRKAVLTRIHPDECKDEEKEATPDNPGDSSFEPVRGSPCKQNPDTGEVWCPDQFCIRTIGKFTRISASGRDVIGTDRYGEAAVFARGFR